MPLIPHTGPARRWPGPRDSAIGAVQEPAATAGRCLRVARCIIETSSPSIRAGSPGHGPTVLPPGPEDLASALKRNIDALQRRREAEAAAATRQEKIADAITRFTGSMRFVYLHLTLFALWVIANLGWMPGVPPWDRSFVVLAMLASVEAIFLSTFVLISQNRMAAAADKRADLDLQINLLAEHEVTRLVAMVAAIADRLSVGDEAGAEVHELKRDVAPEAVLDAIEQTT
jgi:uncharacterized membrane protein